MIDREARRRIQALEAQGVQRDREIADLSGRLSRLAAALEAVRAEATVTRVSPPNPSTPEAIRTKAGPPPPKSAVSSAATSHSPVSLSTSSPAVALPPPPAVFVPSNLPMPTPAVPSVPTPPDAPGPFKSRIVKALPALFTEFRGKYFRLLWRGGGFGFGAEHSDVHKGHGQEHFRGLHAGAVGVAQGLPVRRARSESEEFSFHADQSAQVPGEDICAEGRSEGQSNPLQ
jgi:hypothetical protein